MPQEQNLEEGTERQLSSELRDGTSVSTNLQRGPHSGLEIQGITRVRKLIKSLCAFIAKGHLRMKKISETQEHCIHWIFLLLLIVGLQIDICFPFVAKIDNDKKCIDLDKDFWIADSILRSYYSLVYAVNNILRLLHVRIHARKRSRLRFLVDILIILPVPQVLLILAMTKRLTSTDFFFAVKFYMFQCVLKIIRVYEVYFQPKALDKLAEVTLRFMYLYMYMSYVIGVSWYLFAIERLSACWKKACINHPGCSNGSFDCYDHLVDDKFLNDLCPTKTQNSTIFDSGMFRDAFLSGILETKDPGKRMRYCWRWGMQSICSFGQGLPTSTDDLENYFAVCIITCGVLLLVLFMGQLQISIPSDTIRPTEKKRLDGELEQWLPFRKLSPNLQRHIKYHLYKWQEIGGFDLEILVYLSEYIGREITGELCLQLLKTVEEFGKWRRASLEDLCDFVKPVTFAESSYVIHEGDSIDKMLFVVQGTLRTYNSRDITTTSASPENSDSESDHLKDGDFCGEEVVTWAKDACTRTDPSSLDLPISTRGIQALTKVEAFVLMADDLKNILLIKQKWKAPFIKAARFIKLFMDAVKGTFSC